MKSFQQMTLELNEAKVKLPSGHKQLKNEVVKAGSKTYDLTYSQKGRDVFVFLDGMDTGDTYKNLKDAEKSMKDIKNVLKSMGESFSIDEFKELFNETNI